MSQNKFNNLEPKSDLNPSESEIEKKSIKVLLSKKYQTKRMVFRKIY
jgi:hypothetical protein